MVTCELGCKVLPRAEAVGARRRDVQSWRKGTVVGAIHRAETRCSLRTTRSRLLAASLAAAEFVDLLVVIKLLVELRRRSSEFFRHVLQRADKVSTIVTLAQQAIL